MRDFTTSNASKGEIIEALAAAFEHRSLRIPNDAGLITELQAYESKRTPGGLVTYGAPNGMHDDRVMSLALAYYAASSAPRRRASSKEY